ncbi:MAG: hypothetical protein DHS20C18_36780 [Saprospiraceae bacterium]|nr:MAG: hypothetical protein DHS20C18_36780 [Saprospiraceae bacterium]
MKSLYKKGLRVIAYTCGFFGLVGLALAIHIGITQQSIATSGPAMQLSRIDFKGPIDSTIAARIKGSILHLESVQHAYFNIPDGIVVYSHNPKVQSAQAVYDKIQEEFHLNAERFIVSADMAAGSCPITGKNSLLAKAGNFLVGVFR